MSKLIKRLLSLLLCLCLLTPVIASAENARSVAFTLEGEMYPDAYSLKDQKLMQGLSELIGMADRLLIMKDFEVKKEFVRSPDLKQTDVIEYMI